MGLCCSTTYQQQMEQVDCLQQHNEQQRSIDDYLHPNSSYGVRMGVALVMKEAKALAKAPLGMDMLALEAEVRKAKAEGRTVTITNDCVYIDYQLVGRISSEENFNA